MMRNDRKFHGVLKKAFMVRMIFISNLFNLINIKDSAFT